MNIISYGHAVFTNRSRKLDNLRCSLVAYSELKLQLSFGALSLITNQAQKLSFCEAYHAEHFLRIRYCQFLADIHAYWGSKRLFEQAFVIRPQLPGG